MENPLITHGGKIGDLVWATQTMRSIALRGDNARQCVALGTSPYCRGILPLLERQPWIRGAFVLEDWQVEFSAPIKPAIPPSIPPVFDAVFHLSAREWPTPTLGEYYPRLMKAEYGDDPYVDWSKPWLKVGDLPKREELVVSFSDEFVESKVGAILALKSAIPLPIRLCVMAGSRISKEFGLERIVEVEICDIPRLAERLYTARVAVSCNSLAHPLGVGVGANLVVYEPQPMRWQPIFKAPKGCQNVRYSDSVNSFELIPLVEEALR